MRHFAISPQTLRSADGAPLLELERVSFRINNRALVAELTLQLAGERVIGLVGPNGSGKSTLVRMLAGQLGPSEGVIRLGGRPIAGYGSRELARTLAYLPQFTPPAEGMTDLRHAVEVLDLVRRLSRKRRLGAVIVLHDINMAARFCDEIIALREGRLVARGTPAEILDGAVLQRIYGVAMGILRHPQTAAPIAYVS